VVDAAHVDFIMPGRKKGLLPRVDLPGARCGFLSDTIDTIPTADWPALLPGHAGIDKYVWVWLDQDGVGSCAREANDNLLMLNRAFENQEQVELNPWFGYHTTSGGSDRGSNLGDNLYHCREVGSCPESVWPRSKGWRAKPSSEAYEAAKNYRHDEYWEVTTAEEAGSAMLKGFGLFWGSAGHAKAGVKVLSTEWFKYLNSWGKGWSDPMAGRWLAEQKWPGVAEHWWMSIGIVAAALYSSPESRTEWASGYCRKWEQAYATLSECGDLHRAEAIHAQLQTDEWSGRGVERFPRINWNYGAYVARTAVEATPA